MFGQAFLTALRSIWTKKIRSLLTMLGVIIGVAQIIALIGLGQGVKREITNEVTELGSNILFVLPGDIQGQNGGLNPVASLGASTLSDEDVAFLEARPDVEAVAPLTLLAGVPIAGDRSVQGALILGVRPVYFDIAKSTLRVTAGRSFTTAENASQARVLVIGRAAAEQLFPNTSDKKILDQTVTLNKEPLTIIGIIEAAQSTSVFGGNQLDTIMFLPYETAKTLSENAQIFRMAVRINQNADVDVTAKAIARGLEQQHGVKDFSVLTQEDLLGVVNDILGLITTAIVGLASISLIVGGIGIMNIMLVAVSERTKEIGLRKALGATRGNILLQFLTESAIISLIGGAIGVGTASLAGLITEAKAGLPIVVNLQSILTATGFSLGVGIIFGLLPAIRAARKDPIEALRYE